MNYNEAVKKVLQFFQDEDRDTVTMKEVSNIIGAESTISSRKYVNRMISEGVLSVGKSFLIRNDHVYRLAHGYEVCIKRYSEETEIFPEEWNAYLKIDNEMRNDGFAEVTNPIGESLRIEREGLSLWTEHPENLSVWFDCCDGKIIVKNPDQEAKIKMYSIAKELGAVVEGENGECYGEDGLIVQG